MLKLFPPLIAPWLAGLGRARALGLALVAWVGAASFSVVAVPVWELPAGFGQGVAVALVSGTPTNNRPSEPGGLNLRNLWEAAYVAAPGPSTHLAHDPDQVWAWDDAVFIDKAAKNAWLTAQQRYVARISLVSTAQGHSIHLHSRTSRMDALHVAYRWNNGPWIRMAAGDTIAMNQWPRASAAPSFVMELQRGRLDLVAEFAHAGATDTLLELHSASSAHDEDVSTALVVGLLGGFGLIMALGGLWAAWSFRRAGFLAVSLLGVIGAALVSAHSGLLGVYVMTDSARFSDGIKVFINTVWTAILPLVMAVALSTRRYAPNWWRAALAWALLLLGLSLWLHDNDWRYLALPAGLAFAFVGVCFALMLLAVAVVRKHRVGPLLPLALVLFAVSFFLPAAGYLGWFSASLAISGTTVAALAASLLVFQDLALQYRLGRTVRARAQTGGVRDALTGLLNRQGFEKRLAGELPLMGTHLHRGCAFLYVSVGDDADRLREQFGVEGYELGLVQISAALAAGFSALEPLGRIGPSAFAVAVLNTPDLPAAHAQAQRLLGQLIKLGDQTSVLANNARIAVAWLHGQTVSLAELEQSCQDTLAQLGGAKRIATVDPQTVTLAQNNRSVGQAIDELAREVFGPDTQADFSPTAIEPDSPLGSGAQIGAGQTPELNPKASMRRAPRTPRSGQGQR